MLIVWVDDDDDFLAVVAGHARTWNGRLDLVLTTDPDAPELDGADAWIIDLSMSEVDGLTLVERATSRGIPVAVVTNLAMPHMVREALAAGARAVWDKNDLVRDWPERPEVLLDPQ
jgi:CheY-like chemotaxis protein